MLPTRAIDAFETAGLDLADEIIALLGAYPREVAVEALSQVVGLMCLTRSTEESRASLADFISTAERKRAGLQEIFAGRQLS